ncbi:arsenate reductase family protein [Planctomycetota bacterium]
MVDYIKHPLSQIELEGIVDRIADPPSALLRVNKQLRELDLSPEDYQCKSSVVQLLLEHPHLMQRPIVVRDDTAIIARPSELVEQLL